MTWSVTALSGTPLSPSIAQLSSSAPVFCRALQRDAPSLLPAQLAVLPVVALSCVRQCFISDNTSPFANVS